MTEKNASSADKTREIVEKILAGLFIDGSIKEDHLSKRALQRVTSNFILQNDIKNFTYEDMPGAMLKYKFCYYMRRDLAQRSCYFHVNTSKIEKLAEKYTVQSVQHISQEESPSDKEMSAQRLEYVLTIEQKDMEDFSFSDKSCFVCKDIFGQQEKDKDHMRSHGRRFEIQAINCWPQVIKLTTDFREEEKKFLFKILPENGARIEIDRVVLVLPVDNNFHPLDIYEEENCIQFDIHCEILSVLTHPYSILIFHTLECKSSLLTQFHFTVNKFSDDTDEPIKEKIYDSLPWYIKRAHFRPLPSYDPSDEMKKLTQKNFTRINLTEAEENLLGKINNFLRKDVTQTNYVEFWTTFVEIEDCAAEEQFTKIAKYGVKLIYKEDSRKKFQGYYLLKIPNLSEQSPAIMEGSEAIVSPSRQSSDKMIARVHQVRTKDVILEFEMKNFLGQDTLYDVNFLPNRVTIQLERNALSYVAMQRISKFLFPDTIPTHSIDFTGFEWINESVKTNPEQQTAIMHIVGKSSFPAPYILMGPPGTGKTTTIVEAVCQIIKRDPEARILVAASSNYASDVIALRLLKYLDKTSVYRMYASSKELDLDSIAPSLVRVSNLKYRSHYYPTLNALASYKVILTTLTIAGRLAQANISYKHFSYVFIDESGSSTEPSTLVPIAGVISSEGEIHGQVILAGDPMQLGPVVMADKAKTRLGVSLLERLIDTGIYTRDSTTGKYNPRVLTKLLRNFRSHPKILEYPNDVFYGGELMARGSPEVTHWACGWKYLSNKSVPIVFEHVVGHSKKESNSPSLFNVQEIGRVIYCIQKILNSKNFFDREISQSSIGVISPYKKQCQKISDECLKRKFQRIKIGSVEKFQGQEKPVIILSTVRSQTRGVGFLNNPKRLNVALTRAQALLIVVGNMNTLERDPTWREFIHFCKSHNLVKEFYQKKNDKEKFTSTPKVLEPVDLLFLSDGLQMDNTKLMEPLYPVAKNKSKKSSVNLRLKTLEPVKFSGNPPKSAPTPRSSSQEFTF